MLLRSNMQIIVNGAPEEHPDGLSISDLLHAHKLDAVPCAVEVNKNLVRKPQHYEHTLQEGDTVEIVSLVGGG